MKDKILISTSLLTLILLNKVFISSQIEVANNTNATSTSTKKKPILVDTTPATLTNVTITNRVKILTSFKVEELNSSSHQISLPRTKDDAKSKVNLIIDMLRKDQAYRCEYGENPLIDQICPNFLEKNPYKVLKHSENLTLSFIEDFILNKTTLTDLKAKCKTGEYCLDYDILPQTTPQTDSSFRTYLEEKHLIVCSLANCLSSIELYIEKCVKSHLSRTILKIAPSVCQLNATSVLNKNENYCMENMIRMFYVTVASLVDMKNANKAISNACDENIYKKQCSNECKKMAASIEKIESCCSDSNPIKSFKPLNWYFINKKEAHEYCDTPLTSICWSSGKYYISISPTILIITIILTSAFTLICFAGTYFLFCKKMKPSDFKIRKNSFEYSKLNPNGDEELSMIESNLSDDASQPKRFSNINATELNISSFINQKQSSI